MIEEVSAQYLKELQAEKEELEKNYSENAHAIKLLQNGKEVIKDISWFYKNYRKNSRLQKLLKIQMGS